jgi:hypothetical protein
METKPKLVKQNQQSDSSKSETKQATNQPQKFDLFSGLYGKRITIQEKGGSIVKGTLIACKLGYMYLKDVQLIGRQNRFDLDWIYIDRGAIAHFHHSLSEEQELRLAVYGLRLDEAQQKQRAELLSESIERQQREFQESIPKIEIDPNMNQ